MKPDQLQIEEFLLQREAFSLIDVRSPKEYAQGHIPGAINIPLLSDEERELVGTTYKHKGQQKAIELGVQLCGPKTESLIRQARHYARHCKTLIHCWRGGMRSQSFAQLLAAAGFEQVYTLQGGYKAFRRHVIQSFRSPHKLILLGGMTGSGKTEILHELKAMGEQVIDLEKLASHKGSAFGGIGQGPQPSSEQFENLVFAHWQQLDPQRPVWLEDESHSIGAVRIPELLYQRMKTSQLIAIEVPKSERIQRLVREYAQLDKQALKAALHTIGKKLGQHFDEALEALEKDEFHEVARLVLKYYDKSYLRLMKKKDSERIYPLKLENDQPQDNAQRLYSYYQSLSLSERISSIEKMVLA